MQPRLKRRPIIDLRRWFGAPRRVPPPIPIHERMRVAELLDLVTPEGRPNINALSIVAANLPALALNIKAMGYDLARAMTAALPAPEKSEASIVGLTSKLSVQTDVESLWAAHWFRELKIVPLYHRKLWELAFVLQALHEHGLLEPGTRGLGFGCGSEPTASYFASRGIYSLITDLNHEDARAGGWRATGQHAASLDQAFFSYLVQRPAFDTHVSFRPMDMNVIDFDLIGFDFCWSMCALEHLGSIRHGLRFIEKSLDTLRPGGVAVHTTEFNINPIGPTIDHWPTVLFQRAHIDALVEKMRKKGHHVLPLDYDPGDKPLDRFIDLPPWHDGTFEQISRGLGQPQHLKVAVDGFVSTCIGLIIVKGG